MVLLEYVLITRKSHETRQSKVARKVHEERPEERKASAECSLCIVRTQDLGSDLSACLLVAAGAGSGCGLALVSAGRVGDTPRFERRSWRWPSRRDNGNEERSRVCTRKNVLVRVPCWGDEEQLRKRWPARAPAHTEVEVGLQLALNAETCVGRLEEEAEAQQRLALLDRLHERALHLDAEHLLRLRAHHEPSRATDQPDVMTHESLSLGTYELFYSNSVRAEFWEKYGNAPGLRDAAVRSLCPLQWPS